MNRLNVDDKYGVDDDEEMVTIVDEYSDNVVVVRVMVVKVKVWTMGSAANLLPSGWRLSTCGRAR